MSAALRDTRHEVRADDELAAVVAITIRRFPSLPPEWVADILWDMVAAGFVKGQMAAGERFLAEIRKRGGL